VNIYIDQLASVVRATRFRGRDVFWFGRRLTRPLPLRFRRLLPDAERDCRVTALHDHLYADFYCRGIAVPAEPRPARARGTADAAHLVAALSAANAGGGYVDPGWEIRRVSRSALVVARDGVDVIVQTRECELLSGSAPATGICIGVRFPKELTGRLPGFYVACGNRPLSSADARALVRIYWNVTPRGAIALMRAATSILNTAGIAFELKVLPDLAHASRADAAVLYVARPAYAETAALLPRIYAEVAAHLGRTVPALTKVLAPGIGLAEDPGDGTSFGEHRCRLLASALIEAHETRRVSHAVRLGTVRERLASNGVSVDAPYLNAGSTDIYGTSLTGATAVASASTVGRLPLRAMPDEWMATAERIGDRICRDAAWSDGQCSWMGAGPCGDSGITYESLRSQLYDGTSGVGLFLAELTALTGDVVARRTALGAMRHALARAEVIGVQERPALFAGWTGIAVAAARVGVLTHDGSLVADATDLLGRIDLHNLKIDSPDVISGAAGAIVGLLASRSLLGDVALETAIELADALLASGTRTSHHWSWRSVNRDGELNLTGFSHGAAGIAWALLEVCRACGVSRYRVAADMAFEYERKWFDVRARNWRDLRGYPARGIRRDDPVPCSAYWCHGAPGIALSRLRAFQITGEPCHKAEALAALETTAVVTERALDGVNNFSLCHGVAGNADVLLTGAGTFADELPHATRVARLVGAEGIERHAATDTWPSGANASTPALMTGLAGVGHFYLRLARPATPSVLLMDVDAFLGGDITTTGRSTPLESVESGAMAGTR
jgi:Lanthionine synthetase C-like protein/HopA1 effector protein family